MVINSGTTDLPRDVLDECAREPIHIPGGIQPFGTLLALDGELVVRQCGANVEKFLGSPPENVLGRSLASLLGEEATELVRDVFAEVHPGYLEDLGDIGAGDRLPLGTHALVHKYDGVHFVELVPGGEGLKRVHDHTIDRSRSIKLVKSLRQMAVGVKSDSPVDVFCAKIVRQIRTLTAYDRVMVYRFDSNANGEVIAETKRDGLEPFLGLWYPASDIPPQARELYLRNPIRGLADVTADPVPLVPRINPTTGRDLDLSHALTRALSPVHREYLLNMGVRGTLSASITLHDKLWGLLVCHHSEPYPPECPTVGLLGGMAELIAAHVALIESREWTAGMVEGQKLLRHLPSLLEEQTDWATVLVSREAGMMEALGAEGIVVVHDDKIYMRGLTPPEEEIRRLTTWLDGRDTNLFVTDQLGIDAPGFAHLAAVACGLVSMQMPHTDGARVMWFRPEVASTVQWAGDPRKGLVEDTGGRRLTPRKSFEAWVQTVKGKSRKWSIAEQAIAGEAVRTNLVDIFAVWQRKQILGLQTYQGILFQQVNDAVVVTDPAGLVRFWNDAATRLYGWARSEVMGKPLWHDSPPEYATVLKHMFETIRTDGDFLGEHLALRKDGSQVWVHLRGQRLLGSNGAPLGFVGIARDITENKKAEAELRLMQTVITNTRDAIVITDAEAADPGAYRIRYANPAFLEMTGYRADEILGQSPPILRRPETDAKAREQIRLAREQRQQARVELLTYRKDGSEYWVELDIVPITDDRQSVGEYALIQRDITERVLAREALRESEERLRSILDQAPMIFFMKSFDGRLLFINRRGAIGLGLEREQIEGRPTRELFPPQFAEQFLANDRIIIETLQPREFEEVLPDSKTRFKTVQTNQFPLFRADGTPYAICGICNDISVRKRMEQEVRQSESRFRALVEGLADPIYLHDGSGRIQDVNPSACASTGYTREELLRLNVSDIDTAFTNQALMGRWTGLLQSPGESMTFESSHRRKDGTSFPVEIRESVLQGGDRPLFLKSVRDITERQKIARELKLQARVLESMGEGVSLSDENGIILYTNPAEDRIFGYEPGELVGQHVSVQNAYPPEENQARVAAVIETLNSRGIWAAEWSNRRKDGTPFTTSALITTFSDANGQKYFVCVQSDVTERNAVEAARRESEQRLSLALEHGNIGLWDWNIATGHVLHSKTLTDMLGYEQEDFPPRVESWQSRIHPDDRARVQAAVEQHLLEGGERYRTEHRLRMKNGEWCWIVDCGRVIQRDENGRPTRMIGTHTDITLLKQIESELRESEQRFQTLAASSPVGIFRTDAAGTCLYVNERWCRIAGMTREQAIASGWSDAIHPDDRAEVFAYWNAAVSQRAVFRLEYRFRDPAGTITWVLGLAVPERDELGAESGYIGTITDITELKRTEGRLRESEERFRLIFANAASGIARIALDGRFLEINETWSRLLGYSSQEMLKRTFQGIAHPEEIESDLESARRLIIGEIPNYTHEKRFIRNDGSIIWVNLAVSLSRKPDGTPDYFISAVQDISERKLAESALLLSEERFNLVVRATNDAVWDWDLTSDQMWRNETYFTLFGLRPDELPPDATAWKDRLHPDDRQRVCDDINAVIHSGGELWSDEYRYRRGDGTFAVILDRGFVIRNAEGRPVRMIGAKMDITERKQAEEAMKQSEARYARAVRGTSDGIWDINLVDGSSYLSPRWKELLGYTEEELTDSPDAFTARLHPEDRGTALAALQTHLEQGGQYDIEVRLQTKSGEYRWFRSRGQAERDARGVAIRIAGSISDITERKHNEEEIRRLNADLEQRVEERTAELRRTEAIIEASTDLIALATLDGRVFYANRAFRQAAGLAADFDIATTTVADFHPKSTSDRILKDGWPVAGRDGHWIAETEFLGEGGKTIPVSQLVLGHRGPDADLVYYSTIIRDISERKRNEEALRESEERFRLIAETIQDVFWMSTPGITRILYVSPAYEQLWGQTLQSLYENPHSLLEAIDPEDRPAVIAEIARHAEGKYEIEYRIRTADGTRRWIRDRGYPVRGADGELRFMTGTASDITQRKVAEEAVRESERQSRLAADIGIALVNSNELSDLLSRCADALVRHLGVAFARIWTLNAAAGILELQASAGLYTYINGEYTRIPIGKYKIGRIAETRTPLLSNHLPGDEELSDPESVTPEGMNAFAGYPLIVGGRLVGVMALFSRTELPTDSLTLLAAVANQIAVGIERVRNEQAVRERSEELGRANTALAKAARLKDEFLASMSHELRTPLNGVLSLSEALQEEVYGPLNPEQIAALRDIEGSGRHLLTLINDILDLSKIEAGEVRLELTPTPVERVCEAGMRLVKEMAHKKRLRTTISIDGKVSVILADERRLKQILVNLLSNAVKFTPSGGAIGLEVTGDVDEQTITFAVWDTGIGIRQENMGLLFRAFQQIDSRLSREYSGTGLGLALVQRMTDLHGGSVGVQSEPGKGSRFTVTIPWQEVHPDAEPERRDAGPTTIQKVLLVEDSATDATHLSRYLAELGITSIVHSSNEGAIERIRKEQPNMVLLDINLPDADGWEVLKALKATPDLHSIPVVIASVIDNRAFGLQLGAADSLVKPIRREMLRATVERFTVPRLGGRALVITQPESPSTGPLILLAEDNEVNARTLTRYLKTIGYRVVIAEDGVQAVRMAVELLPSLILMDIQMPGLDGLEATRQLRAEPQTKAIPIIAITALAMTGDRERCLEAGADEYLTKPLSLKVLRGLLDHFSAKTSNKESE